MWKNISLRNLRRRYFRIQLWAFPQFSLHLLLRSYVARRFFHRLKVQVTLPCRNAVTHFVHWRLPLFLFLNEVPHGRDMNHFSITSLFPYSIRPSSVGLRVRRSISLPFGFTFRSHTNHSFVPPFFLSPKFCYAVTVLFYLVFDCLLKFRQILSAILPWSTFFLPFQPVERLPRIRQFFLDLARGFSLTAYSFWLPWGLFRSLTVGRNHRFLYPPFVFYFCRVPAASCRPLTANPYLCIGFCPRLFF